jgi:hypothetical protein
LKNTKISIFGGISKFRLWAKFGSFGQFWAEIAALTVAARSKAEIFKTP